MTLKWVESGLQISSESPRRKGFGSELVERRVPYELNGTGRLEIFPGGVQATISFPLRRGDSILQTDAEAILPRREKTT